MSKFVTKSERLRRIDRQVREYARRYPQRFALWNVLMANGPKPCESCGDEGRPWFDTPRSLVVQGWRCYACRPASTTAKRPRVRPRNGGVGRTT